MDNVILVNDNDEEIGVAEKIIAHKNNWLHRAFSIFIFHETTNKLLMQQRASHKYHSANLWSNTCCGHPRPGEASDEAASRRLREEMNFTEKLSYVGSFRYQVACSPELFEHEIDHIYIGYTKMDTFEVNLLEVQNYRWIDLPKLEEQLQKFPEEFTPWFGFAIKCLRSHACFSRS